jgi:hypothetical protein
MASLDISQAEEAKREFLDDGEDTVYQNGYESGGEEDVKRVDHSLFSSQ